MEGMAPQSSCTLKPHAPASMLFDQRNAVVGVPLAEDAHVHRHGVDGFEHFADIPRAGGNGRSVGAVGGADAAAEKVVHAVGERGVTLLRGRCSERESRCRRR